MSRGRTIYDKTSINRNLKKYNIRIAQNCKQARIAEDVKYSQCKLGYSFNQNLFNQGIKWFESGLSLDDANDEFRNNASFISGYNKGKWLEYINQQVYNIGREYCEKGITIDEIPENYRNNDIFMNGYNNRL